MVSARQTVAGDCRQMAALVTALSAESDRENLPSPGPPRLQENLKNLVRRQGLANVQDDKSSFSRVRC